MFFEHTFGGFYGGNVLVGGGTDIEVGGGCLSGGFGTVVVLSRVEQWMMVLMNVAELDKNDAFEAK